MYSIGSLTLVFLSIGGIWLLLLTWYVVRLARHYQRLTAGESESNLTQILDRILRQVSQQGTWSAEIEKKVGLLAEESQLSLRHIHVVRFNPFADTGGDQSFILALLNEQGTGVVLSSLHSRGMTRWYAKNVVAGHSTDHELSKEEKQAIHDSLNKKK